MTEVQLLPATRAHLAELAAHIRPADLEEVLASGYESALEALEMTFRESFVARVMLLDSRVAAVFGLVALKGSVIGGCTVACAWSLTSIVVDEHRLTFMRASKRALQQLLEQADRLVNLVDARYAAALQWLECLGWKLERQVLHPASGLPFCLVSIGRS